MVRAFTITESTIVGLDGSATLITYTRSPPSIVPVRDLAVGVRRLKVQARAAHYGTDERRRLTNVAGGERDRGLRDVGAEQRRHQ
jgi:hypothetical protein